MDEIITDLFSYLRFASVSADAQYKAQTEACADWLTQRFQRAGLIAQKHPTDGYSIVVARSNLVAGFKTVLIYGHYDVQPPDPLELWNSPPFEPIIKDNRIVARGAADNKGQLLPHLFGVEKAIKENRLPVNVIFVVEGEEESGSGNLEPFLRKNQETLRCDIAVISDSGMIAPGIPTLLYGMRGIVCLEVRLEGPSSDLHSGIFGGLVTNPGNAMARLIADLQQDDSRISIPGFYDRVRNLEPWERQLWQDLPTTDQDWVNLTGSPRLRGEAGFSSLERIWARPSMDVNGFLSGYIGEGPKTIIPSKASAKISFRLVPDQDADEIRNMIKDFIRRICPNSVRLELVDHHQGPPYLIKPDSPYALAARRALESSFGKPAAMIRSGGTLPVAHLFKNIFGVDTLLIGLEWMDCRVHSPNEYFPIENLKLGVAMNQRLLTELAAAS